MKRAEIERMLLDGRGEWDAVQAVNVEDDEWGTVYFITENENLGFPMGPDLNLEGRKDLRQDSDGLHSMEAIYIVMSALDEDDGQNFLFWLVFRHEDWPEMGPGISCHPMSVAECMELCGDKMVKDVPVLLEAMKEKSL